MLHFLKARGSKISNSPVSCDRPCLSCPHFTYILHKMTNSHISLLCPLLENVIWWSTCQGILGWSDFSNSEDDIEDIFLDRTLLNLIHKWNAITFPWRVTLIVAMFLNCKKYHNCIGCVGQWPSLTNNCARVGKPTGNVLDPIIMKNAIIWSPILRPGSADDMTVL